MTIFEAMDIAFSCPLKGPAKVVLIVLARRADKDGRCFPGAASVASDAGLSLRSAHTALAALDALGLIETVGESSRRTKIRRLCWVAIRAFDPAGAAPCTSRTLQELHSDPAGAACQTLQELHPKQPVEATIEATSGKPQLDLTPPESEKPDDWTTAGLAWSRVAYTSTQEGTKTIKRTNRAPRDRKREGGKHLASILGRASLSEVLDIFRWFEKAPAAAYLRDSKARRGLDTIDRHLEKYLEMSAEWIEDGARSTSTGPRVPTESIQDQHRRAAERIAKRKPTNRFGVYPS